MNVEWNLWGTSWPSFQSDDIHRGSYVLDPKLLSVTARTRQDTLGVQTPPEIIGWNKCSWSVNTTIRFETSESYCQIATVIRTSASLQEVRQDTEFFSLHSRVVLRMVTTFMRSWKRFYGPEYTARWSRVLRDLANCGQELKIPHSRLNFWTSSEQVRELMNFRKDFSRVYISKCSKRRKATRLKLTSLTMAMSYSGQNYKERLSSKSFSSQTDYLE